MDLMTSSMRIVTEQVTDSEPVILASPAFMLADVILTSTSKVFVTLMARDEQSPVRDINVIASSMTLLRVGD